MWSGMEMVNPEEDLWGALGYYERPYYERKLLNMKHSTQTSPASHICLRLVLTVTTVP